MTMDRFQEKQVDKLSAYKTAKRLYRVFTGLQILCLGVLFAPFYVPFITKAYFGDVANVVYKFLTLELGAFLVASALALTFRGRARALRQELDSE
jgi:hypothetical protein